MRKNNIAKDFFQVQREQWRISLWLIALLLIFYAVLMGALISLFVFIFSIFSGTLFDITNETVVKVALVSIILAGGIAVVHYLDARRNGAQFIIDRLEAKPPEADDRHHRQLVNIVGEMCVASGLPQANVYVIPSFALNSMALMERDGTPAVIITEGLMADCSREELEAALAHELAHIARGDAFYMTLVCSLTNIFERLRDTTESDTSNPKNEYGGAEASENAFNLIMALCELAMRLISTLISRRREYLADAATVEMTRNPQALARVIYKAHLKYSFVGDFNLTYSPLFIVSPESGKADYSEGFFANLFSTHPPMKRRIEALASMAHVDMVQIIDEVWRNQQKREHARNIISSTNELTPESIDKNAKTGEAEPGKEWHARDAVGVWQGPFSLEELIFLPWFTPYMEVRRFGKSQAGKARDFLPIKRALGLLLNRKVSRKKDGRKGYCPRCRQPLRKAEYEGAPVYNCSGCGGKAVKATAVSRILARREIGFSKKLHEKAADFRNRHILNPQVLDRNLAQSATQLVCPMCSARMIQQPFSYQYFVPVDRCYMCRTIWFDSDELEILQIIIEDAMGDLLNGGHC